MIKTVFKNYFNQKGFALYLVIVLILVIFAGIVFSISILTSYQLKILKDITRSNKAYFAAEAGIEDAIYRLKKSLNVSSNYNLVVGDSLVNVSIDYPSSKTRIITAKGSFANAFRKLEVSLTVSSERFDFFYGAQAGELGVEMENNSRIEGAGGVAGNVYSNGSIKGGTGATITGNVFVATGMSQNQTHTLYNDDQVFGQTNPIIDIAQSFKPSISEKLVKVSIYIKKVRNPSNRMVRILTDNGGSPSKTILATSTLQANLVGTSYGWVDIVFPNPPNLTSDETYWLMIDASQDNNDYWVWGKDKNLGYGNGVAKYTQDWTVANPVWTMISGDLNFKIFMGGQQTSLEDVIVLGDAHANTIKNSRICGDAYYQTIDSASLNFLNNPSTPTCFNPLTPGTAFPDSEDPPLENMPISDSIINQWKKEAEDGGVFNGDFVVNSNVSLGPKKIQGNLIMNSNNKTLTITGTVYVTGYIDISNGSTIQCDPSYGLYSCIIIADKWIHIINNGIFKGSGQPGSYVLLLTTSPCDGQTVGDCTHYNAAMDIHNNAIGAIFYAANGMIYLHNGVEASELTAKKIHLENNAIIRYEQGLVNANFSSGPGGGWKIVSWKEVE